MGAGHEHGTGDIKHEAPLWWAFGLPRRTGAKCGAQHDARPSGRQRSARFARVGLGSKQRVLTAHVVLRDTAVNADEVRNSLAAALKEEFGIEHATLQVETTACDVERTHA